MVILKTQIKNGLLANHDISRFQFNFKFELELVDLKLPKVQLPTNRKFGFFFAGVFALAGDYFLKESSIVAACIFLVLALTFFLVTEMKADLLLPLNKLWMHFGLLLGKIVSPIVLGVIFFGHLLPSGLTAI